MTFPEVKIPCEDWEGVTRQRVLWILDHKTAMDYQPSLTNFIIII